MPPKMHDNSLLAVSSPEPDSPITYSRRRFIKSHEEECHGGGILDAEEPDDHDLFKRLYEQTIHNSCQLPEAICHVSIEDQLDVFTNCRQPLSMFSFFKEHKTMESVGVEVFPAGAYMLPTFCEYCKAKDTCLCKSHCERPKLYFQKKRPPFAKLDPNRWNPQTDFALTRREARQAKRQDARNVKNEDDDAFASQQEEDDVASLTSTEDGSSSMSASYSKSRSGDFSTSLQYDTTMTNDSYESGIAGRRQPSWMEKWSGSAD